MKRKDLFKAGKRGRIVRVAPGVNHGAPCIWVYYRNALGQRTGKPYPPTAAGKAEALAYAQGIVDEQSAPPAPAKPAPRTVAAIDEAFVRERLPGWRTNTERLHREDWAHFANFVGPHTAAADVTRETIARYREDMEARGYAVNTIRRSISTARQVFAYAQDAELIDKSRIGNYRYRVHKDKRPASPDEYRLEEFGALLAALDMERAGHWRAHAALALCGYQGARSWAVLHVQWADVDFEAGTITWRAEWDKLGKETVQPLRAPTRAILEVVRDWHRRIGYTGPWLFPVGSLKRAKVHADVYTRQSLWAALKRAEGRAKIAHRERRASHGLRRLLAGEVNEMTGDVKLAMEAIGDTDIRQAQRYLKRRDDRLRRTFDRLDADLASNQQAKDRASGEALATALTNQALTECAPWESNPQPSPTQDRSGNGTARQTSDLAPADAAPEARIAPEKSSKMTSKCQAPDSPGGAR